MCQAKKPIISTDIRIKTKIKIMTLSVRARQKVGVPWVKHTELTSDVVMR